MYQVTNCSDSFDFENLTGKFWIKTSGNYNSKELSLKNWMELNFGELAKEIERKKCI